MRLRSAGERIHFPIKHSFDEILLELIRIGPPAQPVSPRKVLFRGERTGEISSYVAGWLVGEGVGVIVLDGANRFDPYIASSFARKALIPPERILKSIRIARAFTCYQMATLMGERLGSFLKEEAGKPWVILLGPISTFLDEDVPEREVWPLFERSLGKIEEMTLRGVPFLLFQSNGFSANPPIPSFAKEGIGGLRSSKRISITRRLFQFSNLVWRIDLTEQGANVVVPEKVLKKFFCRPELGSGSTASEVHPFF